MLFFFFFWQALTTPVSLPVKKGSKKKVGPQLFFLITPSSSSSSSSSSTEQKDRDDNIPETSQLQLNPNFGLTCSVKRFKLTSSSPGSSANRSMQPIEDGQKKKREWQIDCIVSIHHF